MKSRIHTINDLEVFLNENGVFDFFQVDEVGVFGSFARNEKEFNDIDLLLKKPYMQAKGLARYIFKLEEKAGVRIDFVIEEDANPVILSRALEEMKYVKKRKD